MPANKAQPLLAAPVCSPPLGVVRHHLLDLLVLLPANVTLMGIGYQRPPTLFLFPPRTSPRFAILIMHRLLCFSVCIGTRVHWIAENLVHRTVCRTRPVDLAPRIDYGKLQAVFQ